MRGRLRHKWIDYVKNGVGQCGAGSMDEADGLTND